MSLRGVQLGCVRGERTLFGALDVALDPGDALWVQGANGSGKTSLLRLLGGLATLASGSVAWCGRVLPDARADFHRHLFFLGHAPALKDDLSARENLRFAERLAGRNAGDAIDPLLATIGLAPVADLPARRLSQGQRKRLAQARLHGDAPYGLLVLDEPFSALDDAATAQLTATLDRRLAAGAIVVYTTHQPVALQARRSFTLTLEGPPC